MSESRAHIDLVLIAAKHIKNTLPSDLAGLVQYDFPDAVRPTKAIKDFIPDIYFWHEDILIIGEAKTINDFDRQHSVDQYTAYLKECHEFCGTSKLVIAVPWQLVATAKNYLRRLRTQLECEDVVIEVINEQGKSFVI